MRAFVLATVLGCAALAATLAAPAPVEASWLSQALRGGGHGHRSSYYGNYGRGYYGGAYYPRQSYYGAAPYYGYGGYNYGGYQPYSGYYNSAPYGYGYAPGGYGGGYYCR